MQQRLLNKARESGRPINQIRKEFFLQVFLSRVFSDSHSGWVLKGGTGMLVRLPGARHSKDIDLLSQEHELDDALKELKKLCGKRSSDPFTFTSLGYIPLAEGIKGVTVKMSIDIGTTRLDRFTIDLTTELKYLGPVERQSPEPIVELPEVEPFPEFVLYPLADQVADKVCALYQKYGTPARPRVSTRFRDLADLALIVTRLSLDARTTGEAINAQVAQREIPLPATLRAPGPDWIKGYPEEASITTLAPEHRTLDGALALVGAMSRSDSFG